MMMMMEGIKGGTGHGGLGGGGGGRVGVGHEADDMGDGMQCSDHPYRNNPGGICAFCLQEKLGKLVSSSFPLPIRGSSSSSSSPSFRSDINAVGGVGTAHGGVGPSSSSLSLSLSVRPTSSAMTAKSGTSDSTRGGDCRYHHDQEYYTRRARIPFLLAKKKKKMTVTTSDRAAGDIVFKRSKSTTTPRSRAHFLDAPNGGHHHQDFSPRKRGGFWSFLYLSSKSTTASKKIDKSFSESSKIPSFTSDTTPAPAGLTTVNKHKERCLGSSSSSGKNRAHDIVEDDDDDSPNSQATASASSFERKVSRSRSVGCGSRSFSGDFFERISTGFGDCTLRRVESQREGKPKVSSSSAHRAGGDCMKERVKCGGIFGGFILTSSSSSSSSSSYWVSSSAEDMSGKPNGPLVHGRSRSWGWAFASPMRAFSKPTSKDGKRDIIRQASDKNSTPNLSAIPSLLTVRG
ncbi:hypothetical protein FNV43_RR00891 [Rhamnella rubrinervis]|uniref:Uncharacterized protein n=1 Tax=Rhamnella rubrinervis TaxID=2594499 RepID=A0A8K0HNM1_9ROSA|nr:hypothetical protein FNV43_RR00891 [Rhamnella rubrinervis]